MTTQIAVRLDEALVAQLDELVAAQGGPATRTDAVRTALRSYLDQHQREAVTRRLVEGYTKVPAGSKDAWGETTPSTSGAGAALARLEEEEKFGSAR